MQLLRGSHAFAPHTQSEASQRGLILGIGVPRQIKAPTSSEQNGVSRCYSRVRNEDVNFGPITAAAQILTLAANYVRISLLNLPFLMGTSELALCSSITATDKLQHPSS